MIILSPTRINVDSEEDVFKYIRELKRAGAILTYSFIKKNVCIVTFDDGDVNGQTFLYIKEV